MSFCGLYIQTEPRCDRLYYAGMVRGALVGTSVATTTIQVSSNVLYELLRPKVSSSNANTVDWEAKQTNKVGTLTVVESSSNMVML